MKKLLLSLGSVAAVITPVAAVISCGSSIETSTEDTAPTLRQMSEVGFDKIANIIGGTYKDATDKDVTVTKDVLTKDNTKAEFITKINTVFKDSEANKSLYTGFVNAQKDGEAVFYMLKFMQASSNPGGFELASYGIAVKDQNGKERTQEEKLALIKSKILDGKMDLEFSANGIISKFSGEDKDFGPSVGLAAKINKIAKTLAVGSMWGFAKGAMGGNETVAYILNSVGYKLIDSTIKDSDLTYTIPNTTKRGIDWEYSILKDKNVGDIITPSDLGVSVSNLKTDYKLELKLKNKINTDSTKVVLDGKLIKGTSGIIAKTFEQEIAFFKAPTITQMHSMTDELWKTLMGGKPSIDPSLPPADADKLKMRNLYYTDAETAKLIDAVKNGYETKAKWDAFVNKSSWQTLTDFLVANDVKSFGKLETLSGVNAFSKPLVLISSTKEEIQTIVDTTFATDATNKKLYTDFVNSSKSALDIYHLFHFINTVTDANNIKKATQGFKPNKNIATIVHDNIYNGKLSLVNAAKGIVSKFAGDDPVFNMSLINASGTVDKSKKTLIKGAFWSQAKGPMGGEATIKYILASIGYRLVSAN